MLQQLNNFCRRLWQDESGVVLALTVVVFLTLFVIACSVYAIGENIRQRLELQNATDAAAYSAAVVQADALSRIAVINKAMAWEYVQMVRDEMRYDVDVWLGLTLNQFHSDYDSGALLLLPFNACANTDSRSYIGQSTCLAGYSHCLTDLNCGSITINGGSTYSYQDLANNKLLPAGQRAVLAGAIDTCHTSINQMNLAASNIVQQLYGNITNVVNYVLQQDAGMPGSTDFSYTVLATDAPAYFATLTDEARFLQYFDTPSDAGTVFSLGPLMLGWLGGVNDWFNLMGGVGGIQRHYEQQPTRLRASWTRHLEQWAPDCSSFISPPDLHNTVTGTDALPTIGVNNYQTELAKPQILTANYFGPAGAIVVGVARRMRNPLLFMAEDPAQPGLYKFFNPSAGTYAWAAAAARAGYRRPGGGVGEYWTKDLEGWVGNKWNLSQPDWDAELIPLQWADTGTPVLQQLWDTAAWQPLAGGLPTGPGLSSIASAQSGPAAVGLVSYPSGGPPGTVGVPLH